MDRLVLHLQAEDLLHEACLRGYHLLLDLPSALALQCALRMLNVIDMYHLETPESVIQAIKCGMKKSVQDGKLSTRKEAQIVALYRAIENAPDEAKRLADFALTWMCSRARDW